MLCQVVSFGMKCNCMILFVWVLGFEQFEVFGLDICDGVYFGVQYWYGIDLLLNCDLVKCVNVVFKVNLNYSFVGLYICLKILIDVMVKVGSVDLKKVVVVMEGMKYDGFMGLEEICKGDYQVLKNYYLLKGKLKVWMKNVDDYVDIVSLGQLFLLFDKMGCKFV